MVVEQRDAGGLDGDAALLLVLTRIRQARVPGVFLRDDPRRGDERIRERRLTLFISPSERAYFRQSHASAFACACGRLALGFSLVPSPAVS